MNKLNHVAFIMDGNGRWGKKKKKNRNSGHYAGVKTVKKIVEASIKFKIPVVTFYVFSTENWKRPKTEISFLFNLIHSYFKTELKNVIKNEIKINIIGELNKLPNKLKTVLKETEKKTKKNKKITENKVKSNLYTKNISDPDILIRTGGKKRLSNFMLWQLAYSELYFLDKLWPDFNTQDLSKILKNFYKTKRNFGGI